MMRDELVTAALVFTIHYSIDYQTSRHERIAPSHYCSTAVKDFCMCEPGSFVRTKKSRSVERLLPKVKKLLLNSFYDRPFDLWLIRRFIRISRCLIIKYW